MAQQFGIASQAEARHYFQHPVLGARLRECIQLVLASPTQSSEAILGFPDNLKFRSCLTLFAVAAPQEPIFQTALDKYYGGKPDALTLELLRQPS